MIQPVGNRLLVEPLPEDSTVILTDAPPLRRCKVLAAGPGTWIEEDGETYFYPLEVRVGDIVHLPGCVVDAPDHRTEEGYIFITENDIGFKENKPPITISDICKLTLQYHGLPT